MTPKNLVLLSSCSFLLKHLLYYAKKGILKSRHWHQHHGISIGIDIGICIGIDITTVTHFLAISYPLSTKLTSKTFMVQSFKVNFQTFLGILVTVWSTYSAETLLALVSIERKLTVEEF